LLILKLIESVVLIRLTPAWHFLLQPPQ
jgi:hypothetical protein